jgi:hypothetical protein
MLPRLVLSLLILSACRPSPRPDTPLGLGLTALTYPGFSWIEWSTPLFQATS